MLCRQYDAHFSVRGQLVSVHRSLSLWKSFSMNFCTITVVRNNITWSISTDSLRFSCLCYESKATERLHLLSAWSCREEPFERANREEWKQPRFLPCLHCTYHDSNVQHSTQFSATTQAPVKLLSLRLMTDPIHKGYTLDELVSRSRKTNMWTILGSGSSSGEVVQGSFSVFQSLVTSFKAPVWYDHRCFILLMSPVPSICNVIPSDINLQAGASLVVATNDGGKRYGSGFQVHLSSSYDFDTQVSVVQSLKRGWLCKREDNGTPEGITVRESIGVWVARKDRSLNTWWWVPSFR